MVQACSRTLRLVGYWLGPDAPGWPDPRDFVDPTCLELSDGVWVWPDGLAHSVDDHDVRLPAEFAVHAIGYLDQLGESARDVEWWRSRTSDRGDCG